MTLDRFPTPSGGGELDGTVEAKICKGALRAPPESKTIEGLLGVGTAGTDAAQSLLVDVGPCVRSCFK
jgi:hypothetical protein